MSYPTKTSTGLVIPMVGDEVPGAESFGDRPERVPRATACECGKRPLAFPNRGKGRSRKARSRTPYRIRGHFLCSCCNKRMHDSYIALFLRKPYRGRVMRWQKRPNACGFWWLLYHDGRLSVAEVRIGEKDLEVYLCGSSEGVEMKNLFETFAEARWQRMLGPQ